MANQISFIVLGGAGKLIKQFHYSRRTVSAVLVLLALLLAAVAYGVFDYTRLYRNVAANKQIAQELAQQTDQVLHQRQQIQVFATEINTLKEQLILLNQFEKRVRLIAGIQQTEKADGLFGIGGSAPEDINPDLALTQKHDQMLRQMHSQVKQLAEATQANRDSFDALLKALERRKNMLAQTPTIRPAEGFVSSPFGYRVSPFTEKKEFHKGIDIANRVGTPIIATADGVVTYVGEKGLLGKTMVIDHGHGLVTHFAHLNKTLKNRGERVQRGDLVAQMGNSGRTTGPHLHYEVHLNGVPVNPEKYIMN